MSHGGKFGKKVGRGIKYSRLQQDSSMGGHRRHNRLNNNSDDDGGDRGFGSFFERDNSMGRGRSDNSYTGGGPGVDVRSFRMSMRVCGPKVSLCGVLISAWGLVQLLIMWAAFQARSVAFVEDVAMNETVAEESKKAFEAELEEGYKKAANNCWVAALLYLVTLIVSLHQRWLNSRAEPTAYTRYA